MSDLTIWLAVGAGGAFGAFLRGSVYWVVAGQMARDQTRRRRRFGLGRATLIVNLVGSFLLGLGIGWLAELPASGALRIFWLTGFCGALTTFSTFCADAFRILGEGEWGELASYLALNAILSVLGFALGLSVFSLLASG